MTSTNLAKVKVYRSTTAVEISERLAKKNELMNTKYHLKIKCVVNVTYSPNSPSILDTSGPIPDVRFYL